MGKEYLIDTNAVIDYLDNKLPGKAGELMDGMDKEVKEKSEFWDLFCINSPRFLL